MIAYDYLDANVERRNAYAISSAFLILGIGMLLSSAYIFESWWDFGLMAIACLAALSFTYTLYKMYDRNIQGMAFSNLESYCFDYYVLAGRKGIYSIHSSKFGMMRKIIREDIKNYRIYRMEHFEIICALRRAYLGWWSKALQAFLYRRGIYWHNWIYRQCTPGLECCMTEENEELLKELSEAGKASFNNQNS